MSTIQQWTWSGTCLTGCTGTATFVAQVPTDTVPAVGWIDSPILEARYTDNGYTIDLAPGYTAGNGDFYLLPLSGTHLGYVTQENGEFRSRDDGTWRFTDIDTTVCGGVSLCGHSASGTGGVWVDGPLVTTPEPATVWLLGAALILTWIIGRVRKPHP